MMATLALKPELALELGIFAKTFQRASIDEVFDAIAAHEFTCTQWNWACVPTLSSLPESLPKETTRLVKRASARSGVRIAAISATFNLIDAAARERGFARLPALCEAAIAVGCDLLTLCTGTRHATDMWAWHPDNNSPSAWAEMINALRRASSIARRYGISLGIEPETANVVSNAAAAERALNELGLDRLPFSIILDAANLYKPPFDPRFHPEVINDAIARLGKYIAIAHAKDVAAAHPRETPGHYSHVAAGTGILPYPHYIGALLQSPAAWNAVESGTRLPLILHGLDEAQVPSSLSFVRESLRTPALV